MGYNHSWKGIEKCPKDFERKRKDMRKLERQEMRKRGCNYCTNVVKKKMGCCYVYKCPHDECPYHELDAFDTYSQYIKSKGDLLFLKGNRQ
jgi:hypothetical protein